MRINVWLAVFLLAAAGCQKDQVCAPGGTQACACVGGTQGAQTCADDGSRWNSCSCGPAAAPTSALNSAPTPLGAVPAAAAPLTAQTNASNEATDTVGPKPYSITIVSADIAPSKPDGRPWDTGDGPPDPVVTITVQGVGSGTMRSSKIQDATAPKWGQVGNMTINRGDRLNIALVDKDLAEDDLIASWDLEFTGPGKKQLKGTSVNSLVIEIALTK
jgi:hypothetical protein